MIKSIILIAHRSQRPSQENGPGLTRPVFFPNITLPAGKLEGRSRQSDFFVLMMLEYIVYISVNQFALWSRRPGPVQVPGPVKPFEYQKGFQ